jgi:hypothetical protein
VVHAAKTVSGVQQVVLDEQDVLQHVEQSEVELTVSPLATHAAHLDIVVSQAGVPPVQAAGVQLTDVPQLFVTDAPPH